MNVAVMGVGYVGLSALTLISSIKKNKKYLFNVTGLENNTLKGKLISNKINKGKVHIKIDDTKFNSLFKSCFKNKRIKVTTNQKILQKAKIVIVCINCDYDFKNKKVKLNDFLNSIKKISKRIKKNCLLIIQTTLPPGTTENQIQSIIKKEFKRRKLGIKSFYLSHMFERVMPGDIYLKSSLDIEKVYGSINKESAAMTNSFLKKIYNKKKIISLQNPTESEFCKLLENSFRATNISLLDEWNRLAYELKININNIISVIQKRPTHSNLMRPGINVGGYCLTKDPLFAKFITKEKYSFPIVTNSLKINQNLTKVLFNKFKVKEKITPPVLLAGISYKGEVGDVRFSPAGSVYRLLIKSKVKNIEYYDPYVETWNLVNKKSIKFDEIKKFKTIIFCTPHKRFSNIEKKIKKNQNILDLSYCLNKNQIEKIKAKCKQNFFIGDYSNI